IVPNVDHNLHLEGTVTITLPDVKITLMEFDLIIDKAQVNSSFNPEYIITVPSVDNFKKPFTVKEILILITSQIDSFKQIHFTYQNEFNKYGALIKK
ncbi:MAG: hypothetical protein KDC52_04295, partial [Ignavibacteriae bacterium]|nr:hypothetical protein [Ignavibacteriota bacterium]